MWAWQVLDLPWLATGLAAASPVAVATLATALGGRELAWRGQGGLWPAVATLATALGGDGGRDGGPKAGRDGETTGHVSFGGYGPPCGTVLGEL